jgi:ABC-type enterobactin transport system permease subunit
MKIKDKLSILGMRIKILFFKAIAHGVFIGGILIALFVFVYPYFTDNVLVLRIICGGIAAWMVLNSIMHLLQDVKKEKIHQAQLSMLTDRLAEEMMKNEENQL